MTGAEQARRRRMIQRVKALYEEHDAAEKVLVMAQRRGFSPYASKLSGVWEYHDQLERDIVRAEADLPHTVVEKLKRGEL